MIDLINKQRSCNIITLEDPVEYVHKPRNSIVSQREVGTDTDTFAEGLRRIFRQAPDVILVGEMYDHETFEIALKAASTGHLVLSTMQASNSTAAIDGIINSFPDHLRPQARHQLTDALLLIFAQRLLPKKNSEAMVLAWEKLINSYRIKNFIRDNKVPQIRAQIQSEADDYASIDVSLIRLVKDGKLALENALPFADSSEYVMKMAR
jgi:twitching motility protein PilT